jgi:hypothetical protein
MNPLGDNGIFDNQPHHSNAHDFFKTFGVTLAGAYIGSSLDNTRFGRWFNTSRIIGAIFTLVKIAVLSLIGLYVYFVIKVW